MQCKLSLISWTLSPRCCDKSNWVYQQLISWLAMYAFWQEELIFVNYSEGVEMLLYHSCLFIMLLLTALNHMYQNSYMKVYYLPRVEKEDIERQRDSQSEPAPVSDVVSHPRQDQLPSGVTVTCSCTHHGPYMSGDPFHNYPRSREKEVYKIFIPCN